MCMCRGDGRPQKEEVMKVEEMGYNIPARQQGQMVVVSYGYPCDGTVVRRTYDAADRTTRYDIASLDDADEGVFINEEPSIIGRWRPIAADARLE